MASITERHLQDYRRDGVVLLRGLFEPGWLEVLSVGLDRSRSNPSARSAVYLDDQRSGGRFCYDARVVGEVPELDQLMLQSPMAETAAALMGSETAVAFYISVFERSRGTRQRTPWHQDQPSWSASGQQACSLWMALDEVPKETALEFVSGSHRWTQLYQRPEFFTSRYHNDDRSALPAFPDIEADRAELDILAWEMHPGDCVVFHGMTVHGGSGRLPAHLGRRAVSVQWLGDDARYRRVPGGDDPPISVELERMGLEPGDPIVGEQCPIAWPRPSVSAS